MEFPKEFEFKGQWIPVTPIKPNPTRRPPPAIPEPNWAQSMDVNGAELRRLVGNGGGGLAQMPYGALPPTSQPPPISEPNWVQSVEFNGGELGRLVGNGGDGLAQMLPFMRPQPSAISGPNWVQTMDVNGRRLGGNGEGLAHQMQYRRLLAVADPASAGKMNLPPLLADQISERNSGGELNFESSNRNLLLLNGMMFPSMAPKPQYDLPVVPPFLPNLNSLPGNNTAFSVVSEGLATPATPAVMEKNWRERGSELQLPHDIIDLVNEVDSYPDVQNQQNESATVQQSVEAEGWNSSQNQQNESATLQQSIGVEGWNSSQQQEGERMNNVAINTGEENQGIDLNRTPQQKPRRKKYTPKVIRERKPKRTPKAAATPRTAETEATPPNSTGKRKYVRKKKEPNPEEAPPSNITPVEANGNADSRSRSKSVRRSLNFDLEHSQEIDRSVFRQNNLETQTQAREEVHAAVETAVNSSQREGLVGLESSPGCGIGFDLNSSTNQFANETSIRIPQTPIRPTQPGRKEEFMKAKFRFEFSRMISKLSPTMEQETRKEEILKKLASKINCVDDIAGNQSNNSVNGQYQVDSHEASDVQLRGAKRNHNFTDVAQVLSHPSIIHGCNGIDRVHGNNNNTSSNSNPYLSEINKKRRMEDGQKECISNSSTSLTYNPCSGWRTIDSSRNVSQVITFADAQRLMVLRKRQALQQMLMFNQTEREKNKIFRNQSLTSHGALSSSYNKVSTPIGTSDHVNQPLTPEKPPRHSDNNQENEIYGPQARINVLIANQMKSNTRGRKKKEQIPPVNSTASNSSQIGHVSEAFETAPQNLSQKRTHLQSSPIQKCQNDSSSRGSASPGFLSSKALNSYSDPVDEIVRRLMHLNINSECLQNAVVPYAGGRGMMVPFQGPFDIVKKRKPRPKVDLDPESNRVWNLLMGKENSEGAQGTEADKEKWWEEERRVFRGRVDSFIARMHLIQGDRRFSRWKGSVVDSVIGVFLTQNVSDHLSSSAFMCLAARFPPRSNAKDNNENNVETISRSVAINDTISLQGKVSVQELCEGTHKTEKVGNSNDSPQSNDSVAVNIEGRNVGSMKEHSLDYFYGRELGGIIGNESPDSASGSAVTVTSCTSAIEGEDRRSVEDVVSSQNSVASSHNSSEWASHTFNPLNTEAPVSITGGTGNGSSSFMELLHMAGNQRISTTEFGGGGINCSVPNGNGLPDYVNGSGASIYASSNSQLYQNQYDFTSLSCAPTPSYYYNSSSNSRFVGKENGDVINNKGCESHLPYTTLGMNETNINDMMKRQSRFISGSSTNSMDKNNLVAPEVTSRVDSSLPICKNSTETVVHSGTGISFEKNHSCCQSETSSNKIISNTSFLHQQDGHAVINNQQKKEAARTQAQIANIGTQTCLNLHDDHQRVDAAESNVRNDVCTSQKVSTNGTFNDTSKKTKKVKPETEKKSYDWDSLRKKTCQDGVLKKERSMDNIDSLDYEALRRADVNEISNAIRERGMNNMLAERIKAFLDRLVSDHGSIDLEWLRDVPPDKAKDYLLSIRGLGLKSVECVRLLTLHHLAFPVDTNVGRICVRLGWVPLQPLPESLQLHLLEMYPILETIQKYLWPRLCKLDQRTLYELHYQLITFGKVFCTKSKPNCNACPMRGECKHFASAFASARLALPGPEEKGLVRSESPISSESGPHNLAHNPMPMPLPPQLEGSTTLSHGQSVPRNCEPIIEEPASPEPEPECIETSEIDIEDAFYNDPDEIPTIKLNFDEFTQNLQNYFQENNVDLQDGDMSKAIVAITPEVASIPMPKLKNVNRLRTEHLVYELPDSHLLLEGMDKREPGDPCPYLLAIWTPGETAQSIEPPKACCNSQNTGQLCDKTTCFNCNSIREAQAQTVRGTLLIPCRTANRGSFPLNGTYFQVNEVFADHDSSCNPIDVPRDWIWNLPRRTVYFGTSIPSIFKGLTTEGIQHCFWRGFVCVRGFDRTSRAPKPLFARLHFPASKTTGNKRTATTAGNNE